MTLKEILKGKDEDEIILRQLKEDRDILVIPEAYNSELYFNMDVIDLTKEFKIQKLGVDFVKPNSQVIEKKAADIVLIGIIIKVIVLPIVLPIISQFIYDRIHKSDNNEKKVQKARVTFYVKENEVFYEYEGPADKVADALKNFRLNEKDG